MRAASAGAGVDYCRGHARSLKLSVLHNSRMNLQAINYKQNHRSN